jgi:iron-sulfur cluster assembly accessory protein
MITLTESAAEQIKAVKANGSEKRPLRVYAQAGGCCGASYGLAWDEKQEGDQVIEQHGIQMVVDAESAEQLRGSTVDFVDTPQGRGFQIRNPNAKQHDHEHGHSHGGGGGGGCGSGGCGCKH